MFVVMFLVQAADLSAVLCHFFVTGMVQMCCSLICASLLHPLYWQPHGFHVCCCVSIAVCNTCCLCCFCLR